VKILVSLPDQQNEFQLLQAADARETAARLGLEIEILDAETSPVLQIQQILKAIHTKPAPKAVIVEPLTDSGMDKVAGKIAQQGIGLAVLNCSLPGLEGLRDQYPELPLFDVGSNQANIGRVQGAQLRALLPDGGNVLYVHGPHNASAARDRFRGTTEALAGAGIELVVVDAQWSEESAEAAVRRWLRLKSAGGVRIDVVAGQDDSIARGARLAIADAAAQDERWSDVPFLGIDGVPDVGQRLVKAGELTGTVVMPSNTGPALEVLARWMQSGALPLVSLELRASSFPVESELARLARQRRRSA
jgi:ribose transport system substrate-binding protein